MRHLSFKQATPAFISRGGTGFFIPAGKPRGISSDVPPFPVYLTVVSTHSQAVNCSDARNRRWTLITDPDDFFPRSVLLRDLPKLQPGDPLFIDLSGTPAVFKTRLRGVKIGERWRGLIGEWLSFTGDELELLRFCIETGAPLHRLSGLGAGFTPAGDDFITGWLTGKRCLRAQTAREDISDFYRNWDQDSTTWFSKWMIRDAARGRIWRRGAALLEAMESGGVTRALNDILAWGHTSGPAWLAGFAYGFTGGEASGSRVKEMISCKK